MTGRGDFSESAPPKSIWSDGRRGSSCLSAKLNSPLGFIPKGWNLVRLGQVTTKIGTGATPKGGTSVYLPTRRTSALIRSQNVFDHHFSPEGLAFISDEHAAELEGVQVQPDDILLNITGDGITFSRSCIVPASVLPARVNQHVAIIRTDRAVCLPGYLIAYLTHPSIKLYMESFNAGGSRRALTKAHIESFMVPLPPLPEQRAIAHILGTLDDKIELNRKMNETLDEIARALFTSWFVNFDPVRAKAEGRQPEGMDAETAALFPNLFVDSELGPIPEGWEVRSLDEIAMFLNGLALQKFPPTKHGSNLAVIKIAQMKKGNTEGADWASADMPPQYKIDDGDLLFSWSGSLEAIIWGGGPGALNQHLFKVTSADYPQWFVYNWIRTHLLEFQQIAASKATTMGHIQRRHLTEAKVLVPPSQLMEKLNQALAPLLRLLTENIVQNRTLTETRAALLPMLLSGEIQVCEAVELEGAAV